jgi:hypothetical protein
MAGARQVLGGEGREGSVGDGKGIEVRGALGDGVLRRHAEVGSIISQSPAPVLFTEVRTVLLSASPETCKKIFS